MSCADDTGDDWCKEGESCGFEDEGGSVRIKRRVEESLHSGGVEAAILSVWVIAVYRQREQRQSTDQKCAEAAFIARGCFRAASLPRR